MCIRDKNQSGQARSSHSLATEDICSPHWVSQSPEFAKRRHQPPILWVKCRKVAEPHGSGRLSGPPPTPFPPVPGFAFSRNRDQPGRAEARLSAGPVSYTHLRAHETKANL